MTNANESAHPKLMSEAAYDGRTESNYTEIISHGGLTKREYFAAAVMQGMLANEDGVNRIWKKARELNQSYNLAGDAAEKCIAELSVALADALIKELNKPNQ